jgi:hypothetical protein
MVQSVIGMPPGCASPIDLRHLTRRARCLGPFRGGPGRGRARTRNHTIALDLEYLDKEASHPGEERWRGYTPTVGTCASAY